MGDPPKKYANPLPDLTRFVVSIHRFTSLPVFLGYKGFPWPWRAALQRLPGRASAAPPRPTAPPARRSARRWPPPGAAPGAAEALPSLTTRDDHGEARDGGRWKMEEEINSPQPLSFSLSLSLSDLWSQKIGRGKPPDFRGTRPTAEGGGHMV